MTPIKDLKVGGYYRHTRTPSGRWLILRNDACLGGFEVEYTTVEHGVPWPNTTVERFNPDHTWPVELDMYLIQEEESAF